MNIVRQSILTGFLVEATLVTMLVYFGFDNPGRLGNPVFGLAMLTHVFPGGLIMAGTIHVFGLTPDTFAIQMALIAMGVILQATFWSALVFWWICKRTPLLSTTLRHNKSASTICHSIGPMQDRSADFQWPFRIPVLIGLIATLLLAGAIFIGIAIEDTCCRLTAKNRQDFLNVAEVVFRKEIARPAGPNAFCLAMQSGTEPLTPDARFISRFSADSAHVYPISECKRGEDSSYYVAGGATVAVMLLASKIRFLTDDMATVESTYYMANEGAYGTLFHVERKGSSWLVTDATWLWIS